MSEKLGHIKAARLDSPRLQRVLKLLSDGKPHTTRDIVRKARVVAVNAAVAELRHHGAEITCVKQMAPAAGVWMDGWRFYYTMTKAPKT